MLAAIEVQQVTGGGDGVPMLVKPSNFLSIWTSNQVVWSPLHL